MSSMWSELKRRNVVRVAIAYAVLSWLILQLTDVLIQLLGLAESVGKLIFLLLLVGFPLALFFAWAFELTPGGLKKERDVDRSESVTHLTGRKLDFIIIAVLAIALVVFAVDKYRLAPNASTARNTTEEIITTEVQQSIAVMPFVNMSSDPEQEYFSDGLSEEILNLLAKIPGLKVIARTSSFAFKGKNEDVRVIGQQLGVNTLLEGSVRKSGERVRITAQLIDVADGAHLWSESYDRTITDIFAVQDDVAAAIIDALQMHISVTPTRGRPTDNSEAYTLFLKARIMFSEFQIFKAEELLLRAIELDPEFAEAYDLLTYKYWIRSEQQLAYETATKALSLDPDLVLARAVHDQAKIGSHLAGLEAFEKAVRIQPNNPVLLQPFLWNLIQAGYIREAVSLAEHQVEIDPVSTSTNNWLSVALFTAGRSDEAIEAVERADRLSNLQQSEWIWIPGWVFLQNHQYEKAITFFENYLRESNYPDTTLVSDLIRNGRDPGTGQAYLDSHVAQFYATAPEEYPDLLGYLEVLYLEFGFIDRYFELLLEADPNDERWSDADLYLFDAIFFRSRDFITHPKFLELAEIMGLIKIWEQRGPPDFCDKVDGNWVCQLENQR